MQPYTQPGFDLMAPAKALLLVLHIEGWSLNHHAKVNHREFKKLFLPGRFSGSAGNPWRTG
jgi:hypothetical protein